MAITYDDSTVASHPGATIISTQKFLDYYNVKGPKRLLYSMLFRLSLNTLDKLMGNNRIVHEWIGRTEQFKFGCLNPSIVLDPDKGLIATYTNLTNNGSTPTSVVKITSEKLHLIEGKKFAIGQKIPSVAMYYRNTKDHNATSWADFDPRVPHCFSKDTLACDKLLNRLNENHWLCLKIGLEQIQDQNKVGLYNIVVSPEIANSAY